MNTNAEVIDTDGRVIPGLYAAGETAGFYYGSYPGATSVLRARIRPSRLARRRRGGQLAARRAGRALAVRLWEAKP